MSSIDITDLRSSRGIRQFLKELKQEDGSTTSRNKERVSLTSSQQAQSAADSIQTSARRGRASRKNTTETPLRQKVNMTAQRFCEKFSETLSAYSPVDISDITVNKDTNY